MLVIYGGGSSEKAVARRARNCCCCCCLCCALSVAVAGLCLCELMSHRRLLVTNCSPVSPCELCIDCLTGLVVVVCGTGTTLVPATAELTRAQLLLLPEHPVWSFLICCSGCLSARNSFCQIAELCRAVFAAVVVLSSTVSKSCYPFA